MDFIPAFHFITAIIIFGLLFYVYNPIITYLHAQMPTPAGMADFGTAIFFLWGILAGINLIGSGIRFVMMMQRRQQMG